MASIPPAAPLQESGAAVSIERLFGAWKKPNPRPQSAIRHAISVDVGSAGRSANKERPDSGECLCSVLHHRKRREKSVGTGTLMPTTCLLDRSRRYRRLAQSEPDPIKAAALRRIADEAEVGMLCVASRDDHIRIVQSPSDAPPIWTGWWR